MPPSAFTILVVCTANICRSPLAEHMLRNALAVSSARSPSRLPSFAVSSAGVRGWSGAEMDPAAAAELRRLGGDPSDFRARDLSAVDLAGVDLILTATAEHRSYVLQDSPRALRRTFTILELAHLVTEVEAVRQTAGDPRGLVEAAGAARGAATLTSYDIADPYGQPPELFRRSALQTAEAVTMIAGALLGG